MNFSRQALLGIGMIVGGSVMLYAMVQQIGASDEPATAPAIVEQAEVAPAASTPLTTDIDTEKRILAQKQKERAIRVAEQERRAKQFLAEQETAEAKALAKSRTENERYIANTTPAVNDDIAPKTTSIVNEKEKQVIKRAEDKQRAEAKKLKDMTEKTEGLKRAADAQLAAEKKVEAQIKANEKAAAEATKKASAQSASQTTAQAAPQALKSPTDYTVKRGDGLIKLAREYNVPVEALAQANNTSPSASLQLGQTLTIPSRSQIERLEREAASTKLAREEKAKKEEALAKKSTEAKRDAQQKLREARTEVKETDAKGSFGVQVALATNQASADEVAKKFKAAGYQVKTSSTSRGVRVIVGPERGKVAALALKDKVNSDPSVNTTSAWVLYWR